MFSSSRPGEKTLREQGNEAFKEKEWERAIELYTRAIEADYDPLRSDQEQLAALYSNRATAYIQRCEYSLGESRTLLPPFCCLLTMGSKVVNSSN